MRWALFAALLSAPGVAGAATITGTVFVDDDGDGARSADEAPLAGVRVFWEGKLATTTDAQGGFQLTTPGAGIVWARAPEGFRPGPIWRAVADGPGPIPVELGLVPHAPEGDVTFVHASDTHFGMVGVDDARAALDSAIDLVPAPHFLTITGDITNSTVEREFEAFFAATEGFPVPIVPVVGNHDWHDGGTMYRARFGPPQYSFDSGGVHFIALNFMAPQAEQLALLALDLEDVPAGRTVAAFAHAPVSDEMAQALASAGVDFLFTGHYHGNRIIEHGQLVEVNTQTAIMGSLDWSPAGTRVVTITGGQLSLWHHSTTSRPVLELAHPRPGSCVPPGPLRVIAAAELGAARAEVTLSVDEAAPLALPWTGGWTYSAAGPELTAGWHAFVLAGQAGTTARQVSGRFCVSAEIPAPLFGEDWPQLGGSAAHTHARAEVLPPPLVAYWAQPTGGHLAGGAPAVVGGVVYVPVVDLGAGDRGGILALDAASGRELWAHRAGASVHQSPAVDAGVVVYADSSGRVRGLDAASGSVIWEAFGPQFGFLYAGPVIADGAVYVNLGGQVAALSLGNGELRWMRALGTTSVSYAIHGAPAIAGPLGVSALGKGKDGVVAWDVATGDELWRILRPRGNQASPVLDGEDVYLVDIEARTTRTELATGLPRWERVVVGDFDWGHTVVGAPALADGRLYLSVPARGLEVVDAPSGRSLWRASGGDSVLRPLPYFSHASGFLATAVVAGDVVWVGGLDGVLRAYDARDGDERWKWNLGAPIMTSAVPAGQTLYVGTFDGTLRALVVAPGIVDDEGGGCAVAPGRPSPGTGMGVAATVLLLALLLRRRKSGAAVPSSARAAH